MASNNSNSCCHLFDIQNIKEDADISKFCDVVNGSWSIANNYSSSPALILASGSVGTIIFKKNYCQNDSVWIRSIVNNVTSGGISRLLFNYIDVDNYYAFQRTIYISSGMVGPQYHLSTQFQNKIIRRQDGIESDIEVFSTGNLDTAENYGFMHVLTSDFAFNEFNNGKKTIGYSSNERESNIGAGQGGGWYLWNQPTFIGSKFGIQITPGRVIQNTGHQTTSGNSAITSFQIRNTRYNDVLESGIGSRPGQSSIARDCFAYDKIAPFCCNSGYFPYEIKMEIAGVVSKPSGCAYCSDSNGIYYLKHQGGGFPASTLTYSYYANYNNTYQVSGVPNKCGFNELIPFVTFYNYSQSIGGTKIVCENNSVIFVKTFSGYESMDCLNLNNVDIPYSSPGPCIPCMNNCDWSAATCKITTVSEFGP